MYIIEQINKSMAAYIEERRKAGKHTFAFEGGRRSGKTICISQFLLLRAYNHGEVVNIATMTEDQGRNGVYTDMCMIISDCPTLSNYAVMTASPMRILFSSGGKIIFKSYKNSETAKGFACDWLYANEANNFSLQQVTDLRANVRKGSFFDWNPCEPFWANDMFDESEIHHSDWRGNPFLTPAQHEYFEDLKRKAESPNASPLDIYNYNRYYLGIYSELRGSIFIEEQLKFIKDKDIPSDLYKVRAFCDPSAMVSNDYFAGVLSARSRSHPGLVYILDAFSTNDAGREWVIKRMRTWAGSFDDVAFYIETNGYIGEEFFKYAKNSGLKVKSWYSNRNKFERICAAYEPIRDNMYFCDTPEIRKYMLQVYDFSNKCEHDDNADALASTYYLSLI